MCWSGKALKDRLNRLLPNNKLEFAITSGDYIFKKPNKMLFEIALNKAGLKAEEKNPFEGQNDGYKIDFDYLKINDWDELYLVW